MSDFILGVVLGILIGWLFEYYGYRRYAEAEADERKRELKVAQQHVANKTHEIDAQSAEINALRNKLAEAQSESDNSASAAQAEAERLAAELEAAKAELADAANALSSANASADKAAAEAAAALEAAQAELADANSALSNANSSAEQAAADAATELEEYRTKLANCEAQLEMASGVLPDPDDLKRIEGIGPKVSSVLIDGGIRTFGQLANASIERIQQILTDGGMSRINDPGTWPEQAALAAAGDWDALEKLQDELVGGRRV